MVLKLFSLPHSEWVIFLLSGTLKNNESSVDTLKKLSQSLPAEWNGIAQLFPATKIGGFDNLAWAGFSTFQNMRSQSLHFRKPEMEWLGYVSGNFQTEKAISIAGLSPGDKEVVLALMGPKKTLPKKLIQKIASQLKISPQMVSFSKNSSISSRYPFSKEIFMIEKSALAGLD